MWECECWNKLAGRIGAHMATAVGEGVWSLRGLIYCSEETVQGVECCCSREERTGISLSCQISSGAANPLMMVLHCHSGTLELIISLGRHLDQHHYLWRQKHQRCPLVRLSLLYTMWFAFDASKIFF